MTEFERERSMPAGPEAVFAVAADLGRLGDRLPPAVSVQPVDDGGPGTTRELHAEVEPHGAEAHGVDARGLARVRPEQRRVEWGGGDSGATRATCR